MPASVFAHIIFRVYALHLALSSIFTAILHVPNLEYGLHFYMWLTPLAGLVVGGLVWFLSPWICRLAAGKNDTEFSLESSNLRNLYATAFLALGAYFAVKSFAVVFNWLHYFAVNRSQGGQIAQDAEENLYQFSEPLLTMFAGLTLLCTARIWARKLVPEND